MQEHSRPAWPRAKPEGANSSCRQVASHGSLAVQKQRHYLAQEHSSTIQSPPVARRTTGLQIAPARRRLLGRRRRPPHPLPRSPRGRHRRAWAPASCRAAPAEAPRPAPAAPPRRRGTPARGCRRPARVGCMFRVGIHSLLHFGIWIALGLLMHHALSTPPATTGW